MFELFELLDKLYYLFKVLFGPFFIGAFIYLPILSGFVESLEKTKFLSEKNKNLIENIMWPNWPVIILICYLIGVGIAFVTLLIVATPQELEQIKNFYGF